MRLGGVFDLVNGVKAQAVEAELRQPVQRRIDNKLTHRGHVIGDAVPPRGHAFRVEEVRGQLRQVVTLRSEMVKDNIQHHRQPQTVGGIDKGFQLIRRTVGTVRGIQQYAVVTPATVTSGLGDRHQLNHGNAERGQVRQFVGGRAEGALRGKGPDMKLINNALFPGAALPVGIAPDIAVRIAHQRRAVDIPLLRAGGRIGYCGAVRQDKTVRRTWGNVVDRQFKSAVAGRVHRQRFVIQAQGYVLLTAGPQMKANVVRIAIFTTPIPNRFSSHSITSFDP